MALFTIGISIRQKFLFACIAFTFATRCMLMRPYIHAGQESFQTILIKKVKLTCWAQNSQISYDTNICLHKTHEISLLLPIE